MCVTGRMCEIQVINWGRVDCILPPCGSQVVKAWQRVLDPLSHPPDPVSSFLICSISWILTTNQYTLRVLSPVLEKTYRNHADTSPQSLSSAFLPGCHLGSPSPLSSLEFHVLALYRLTCVSLLVGHPRSFLVQGIWKFLIPREITCVRVTLASATLYCSAENSRRK